MSAVTTGLSSSCAPTYRNVHCGIYPSSDYQCSPYVGNKLVYNYTEIARHENEIKSTFNLVKVILGDTACANLLFSLMCIRMFPPCLNWNQSNGGKHPQKICSETCLSLHNDVCRQNLNEFGEMVMQFESITLDENIKLYMGDLLIFKCNESDIYPSIVSNPYPECFTADNLFHEYISDTCHSNGFHYQGSLNNTVNQTRCKPWSVMCSDNHLFNYSVIANTSENYCRNPSSYRDAPWCYVDDVGEKWEYCNIPKCPVIHGGYGQWTPWSNCTGSCGSYLHQFRTRECDNPLPRYGGKNCSSLGISTEKKNCGYFECKKANKTFIYVIIGSMAGVISLLISAVCFLKLRNGSPILEYDELYITPDTIHDMTTNDKNQDLLAENVYEHLKNYSLCFCMNCIKNWVISTIKSATDIDHETKSEIIKKSLERLKTYKSKTNEGQIVVPPDVVPINDGNNINCRCEYPNNSSYSDKVLRDWLNDTVHYSKLSDASTSSSRPMIGILKIEGYRIMPVYDKLSRVGQHQRQPSETNISIASL